MPLEHTPRIISLLLLVTVSRLLRPPPCSFGGWPSGCTFWSDRPLARRYPTCSPSTSVGGAVFFLFWHPPLPLSLGPPLRSEAQGPKSPHYHRGKAYHTNADGSRISGTEGACGTSSERGGHDCPSVECCTEAMYEHRLEDPPATRARDEPKLRIQTVEGGAHRSPLDWTGRGSKPLPLRHSTHQVASHAVVITSLPIAVSPMMSGGRRTNLPWSKTGGHIGPHPGSGLSRPWSGGGRTAWSGCRGGAICRAQLTSAHSSGGRAAASLEEAASR